MKAKKMDGVDGQFREALIQTNKRGFSTLGFLE
jgi:hypothetical protein